MFRFSARDVHAWRDLAQNVGKLSLAGLFLTGTFLLAHAYADPSAPVSLGRSAAFSAYPAQSPQKPLFGLRHS